MFQFEGYTLDLARHLLRAGDREIPLRPKSFEVLRHLVENAKSRRNQGGIDKSHLAEGDRH